MFCKLLLALLMSLSALSVSAGEVLAVDYQYKGEHDVDFSTIPRGPLKIAEFGDARTGINPQLVTGTNGDAESGHQLDRPVADLLRAALVQGFEFGGAGLVGEGESLVLTADVQEFSSSSQKDGEKIGVTVRAKVQLKNSTGRQVFSTSAFGSASAPSDQGLAAAVSASLDEFVGNLFWDDYFLMQVVD